MKQMIRTKCEISAGDKMKIKIWRRGEVNHPVHNMYKQTPKRLGTRLVPKANRALVAAPKKAQVTKQTQQEHLHQFRTPHKRSGLCIMFDVPDTADEEELNPEIARRRSCSRLFGICARC
jgi:hypothetical protein